MAAQGAAGITNIVPAITLAGVGVAARGLLPKIGLSAVTGGLTSALGGLVVLATGVSAAGQTCSRQTGYRSLGVQLFGSVASQ
jgi:hypothetical protein